MSRFHLLIFIFSFLILTRFTFDPDLGWHLVIGNKFLESGEIIKGDIFTWTLPGYEWGNRYFLYQILVAFLFNNLGYVLTTVVFGLIGAFSIFLLLPKKLDFVKLVAVLLGVGVAVTNLGLRPHMISFLLYAILLVLLERNFFLSKLHALFWFVFFAIWANFHQAFFVGILTLGAFIVLDFLWQISKNKWKRDNSIYVRAFCILLAFLGGLLTPFHSRLFWSLVDDLLGGKTWMTVAEWQPVVIFLPWSLLYAVSGLVFVYVFYTKFKQIEPVWFLVGALMFMLPFLAVNFVFFWAAFFIFIASRFLEVEVNFNNHLTKLPIIFSSISAGLALVLGFLLGAFGPVDLDNRLIREGYPVEAVNFMKKEGYKDRVFNSYAWGGYIDFAAPEIKVFIDGRMTGWRKQDGDYILADYIEILRGNCELFDKYQVETVLVEDEVENECFSDYNEVYQDSVAKILTKS